MMKTFLVVRPRLCVNMALSGAIVAVLLSLYHAHSFAVKECGYLYCLLLSGYGILQVEKIKFITPLLVWLTPQLVLVFMLGNFLSESMQQNAVYIFTRTNKRKKWLYAQLLILFLYSTIYTAVQFIVVLLSGYASGLQPGMDSHSIEAILMALLLLVMQNVFFVVAINMFSLVVSAVQSTAMFMLAHVGGVVLAWFIHEFTPDYSGAIVYFPFTQGIYSWHSDAPVIASALLGDRFRLADYSVVFSIGYMFVMTVALALLGAYRLEKMDLR
ncbi:hypothetical protein [Brevibacillus sp. SAFN-007a]|uniref:hypothetical protein n=1 Tax=Brevibacillus sp. SAFN-007a TaxID=3436862 RepID=UPI003F7EC896